MKRLLLALLLLIAFPVTACNDSSDSESTSEGAGSEGTGSAETAAYEPDCTTEPELTADGLTAPGALLCFGTPAVLPAHAQGGHGRVRITVTGVEDATGASAEEYLAGIAGSLEGAPKDHRLVFTHFEFSVLEESAPGVLDNFDPGFFELSTSMRDNSGISVMGMDPDGCESADLEALLDEGSPSDSTVKSCDWTAVRGDDQVLGALMTSLAGDVDHGKEYDSIIGDPVRWKAAD